MAIGALNVALTGVGGFYRSKSRAMAVATAGVAAAAFIGTLAGQTPWAAVPVAFHVAAAGGLAGIFGSAANKISFSILGVFVIPLGLPGGLAVALQRFVACLAGGLWTMALSLRSWPTHPFQPAREAVAVYYQAVRNLAIHGALCPARRLGVFPGVGQGAENEVADAFPPARH